MTHGAHAVSAHRVDPDAALQDLLGVLNDADVAAKMLKELDVSRNPASSYPAGLIGGWCARGALGDDDAAARAAWRSLKKAKRPWRAPASDAETDAAPADRADG